LEDFNIVAEIDGNYHHLGAAIADAVLQANMKYETHVRPRIARIMDTFPDAATMSGLKKILMKITSRDFLDWRGMDRVNRFQAIIDLLSSEKIETEENLKEWLTNDRNLIELTRIKGIGPKTIDYLKILTGIQTCAIDRRLLDFLKQAGIKVSGYDEAKAVINLTADILGVQRAYLDHSIWKYIGKRGSPRCT
jgi:hypothetical protein